MARDFRISGLPEQQRIDLIVELRTVRVSVTKDARDLRAVIREANEKLEVANTRLKHINESLQALGDE